MTSSEPTPHRTHWDIAACALAAALIVLIAVRWHNYQWDFSMFRWSAADYLAGRDPYKGQGLSLYHPPFFLPLYGLFTRTPYVVGYELWLAAKVAALGILIAVWNRRFVRLRAEWPTILFFVFAFNAALYADLVSGNVSLFEQLGVWVGFAFLLQGRPVAFAVCLALAAQWKGTPLLLLAVLLAQPKPNWRAFGTGVGLFAALFSLNVLLYPGLFARFMQIAPRLDERAPDNPCLLALLRDTTDGLGRAGIHVPGSVANIAFALLAAAVLAVSMRAVWRYRRSVAEPDMRLVCLYACVVLALVSPRFKSYTYILLLIPTLYAIRNRPRNLVPLVAVFALGGYEGSLLPFREVLALAARYLPLLGAAVLWAWYLREIRDREVDAQLAENRGEAHPLAVPEPR